LSVQRLPSDLLPKPPAQSPLARAVLRPSSLRGTLRARLHRTHSMKKTTKTVSTATRALLDEMERDAKPSGDKLDRVRSEIFRLRDLEFQRDALAERVKVLSAEAQQIKDKTLVDLFDEAGVNSLGIDADGNMPPYEV
jgi:hypothetical protein